MLPHICVVGSANIDLTFCTPRLLQPGETLASHAFHRGYGGKGANQAVMAARLGARVSLVGRVGDDVFGEQTLTHYRTRGIDTTHLRIAAGHCSGTAAIIVDDAARNAILVVPGANLALSPADVREAASTIQSATVLLTQLEVPVETTWEALRLARAAGVTTILNPAPAVPLPDELLALADLCVPNETEIELLTGLPVGTLEQETAAAHALRQRGPRTVILTLGSRGALVATAGTTEILPPPRVTPVDPTGAGDAFIGSLAVFLGEDYALREAVRRANAAAALSVTRPGAQTSFPEREEVVALCKEFLA